MPTTLSATQVYNASVHVCNKNKECSQAGPKIELKSHISSNRLILTITYSYVNYLLKILVEFYKGFLVTFCTNRNIQGLKLTYLYVKNPKHKFPQKISNSLRCGILKAIEGTSLALS